MVGSGRMRSIFMSSIVQDHEHMLPQVQHEHVLLHVLHVCADVLRVIVRVFDRLLIRHVVEVVIKLRVCVGDNVLTVEHQII